MISMKKIIPEKFNSELKKLKLPAVIKRSVTVISDKKGEDIVILKLKGLSDLTDYMVICSGRS